jgi:hypothetical protein
MKALFCGIAALLAAGCTSPSEDEGDSFHAFVYGYITGLQVTPGAFGIFLESEGDPPVFRFTDSARYELTVSETAYVAVDSMDLAKTVTYRTCEVTGGTGMATIPWSDVYVPVTIRAGTWDWDFDPGPRLWLEMDTSVSYQGESIANKYFEGTVTVTCSR